MMKSVRQIQLLLIAISLTLTTVAAEDPWDRFLMACSQGNLADVQALLERNPQYAKKQSSDGETCLHVAGILGQTDVTKLALKHGADPNSRSGYSGGLRMTPLAWNTYGGHVETAKALLEGGADPNLDMDDMKDQMVKVTVLDILHKNVLHQYEDNEANRKDPNIGRHFQMYDALMEHGAKFYKDLATEDL